MINKSKVWIVFTNFQICHETVEYLGREHYCGYKDGIIVWWQICKLVKTSNTLRLIIISLPSAILQYSGRQLCNIWFKLRSLERITICQDGYSNTFLNRNQFCLRVPKNLLNIIELGICFRICTLEVNFLEEGDKRKYMGRSLIA